MINIRPATEMDMEASLGIYNHVLIHTTASFEETPRPLSEYVEAFRFKQANGIPWIVAEDGDTVVGYGTWGRFRTSSGYKTTVEHSLHVHADHRGRGIGSVILQNLIALAKEQSKKSMVAGIDKANTASIEIHKKHGFKVAGELTQVARKFDRWLDLVFMQLVL